MKPSKIRITKSVHELIKENKIYDVIGWYRDLPLIKDEVEYEKAIQASEWEPVFQAGDPVWAWNHFESSKIKGLYIGTSQFNKATPHFVGVSEAEGWNMFKNISWREEKKQITLNELAEKAGINLNEYEIVE